MTQSTTTTQKQAIATLAALAEAIRDPGSIPSGHLYAQVMTRFASLDLYESCIGLLVQSGLVTRKGHLLVWSGPAIDDK